jgi:hypothetical protein
MKLGKHGYDHNHLVPLVEGGTPAAQIQRQLQTVWWGTTYADRGSDGLTHTDSS